MTDKQQNPRFEHRTEAIKVTKACDVLWQCMLRGVASLSQPSARHTAKGTGSETDVVKLTVGAICAIFGPTSTQCPLEAASIRR